ncbi:MAG TPA: ABC transporter substrate-binding protein [Pseudomonas sp.]|jgi:polar amino acid transport system substrate-binding protein|uniref:ABC transporter substrate-binding protein n=1 Tax=Pseudomonas oryzihabitans TaxID=47885 RepID=A0A0U4VP70_9PSED|nr:ABC transporter substrate-binding protein [Pseudomonas oryzihabitans]ALZ84955.1 ABC transporter substrate-binding protein [Pseudomonas oryzihabitans]HAC67907.1 ABC transporter substrate-binding protein [Pseudomonas sp.]
MTRHRLSCSLLALTLVAGFTQAAPQIPDRLAKASKITYCGALDTPPIGFFDEAQKPKGLTVDLGAEIAKRLGDKKVDWRVVPFSGLIPALLAGQCDVLIDQLFDKPERRQVIDIVNYMYSSQAVVVPSGNKAGIHTLDDLAGKKVAVLNGSTIRTLLDAHNEELKKAGKAPMKLVAYNSDTDAFQALRLGQTDAYGTTVETAAYYQGVAPGQFETGVPAFARILTGVGVRKDDSQLSAALTQILADMRADGSYASLMAKWHLEGDKLD